jgi:hypothetical protein
MHGLKCLICGKEYFYDSKICHECQDYAIYSGLVDESLFVATIERKNCKWNCSRVIKSDLKSNKMLKRDKIHVCITKEPRNYSTKAHYKYSWNTESINKLKTCLEESIKQSKLNINPDLLDDIVDFLKVKTSSLLIYE